MELNIPGILFMSSDKGKLNKVLFSQMYEENTHTQGEENPSCSKKDTWRRRLCVVRWFHVIFMWVGLHWGSEYFFNNTTQKSLNRHFNYFVWFCPQSLFTQELPKICLIHSLSSTNTNLTHVLFTINTNTLKWEMDGQILRCDSGNNALVTRWLEHTHTRTHTNSSFYQNPLAGGSREKTLFKGSPNQKACSKSEHPSLAPSRQHFPLPSLHFLIYLSNNSIRSRGETDSSRRLWWPKITSRVMCHHAVAIEKGTLIQDCGQLLHRRRSLLQHHG